MGEKGTDLIMFGTEWFFHMDFLQLHADRPLCNYNALVQKPNGEKWKADAENGHGWVIGLDTAAETGELLDLFTRGCVSSGCFNFIWSK